MDTSILEWGNPHRATRRASLIEEDIARCREFIEINESYTDRTLECEAEAEELWMWLRDLERELGRVLVA